MTTPDPDPGEQPGPEAEIERVRQAAGERLVMEYPIEFDRVPDVLRDPSETAEPR